MQVDSISALNCGPKRRILSDNEPVKEPIKQPEEPKQDGEKAQIYFGNKKSDKSAKNMRNGIMALCFLPVAGSVATSCSKEIDLGELAYAHAVLNDTVELNENDTIYHETDTIHDSIPVVVPGDTVRIRDTIYIDDRGVDTVYVDTGSYHHTTDTIVKWKENYVRPIPLDSLIHDLDIFGVDSTDVDYKDPDAKRNIIHWEADREWEYNTKEIADMNVLESSKKILVYDTEIKDYKGRHESFGKTVFRIPPALVKVQTANGAQRAMKGLFIEQYENNSDDKNASILDCKLVSRVFVQTQGDSLKVFVPDANGIYKEDGAIAKGYLGKNSVLLRNLIGEYDTDDHLVDMKVSVVDDETLKNLYVRKRDEQEAAAEAPKRRRF